MGHERVGALPRSKRWRDVVGLIAGAAAYDGDVDELAQTTIANVRDRLQLMHLDSGFATSFQFLLRLALSASTQVDADALGELLLDLGEQPSPLALANQLSADVENNRQSAEYAELARKAAVDTIALWTERETRQIPLFGGTRQTDDIWRNASDAAGFCDVSRLFFAKFVERYLNYFLSREASSQIANTESRERLDERIALHVDEISHHAFETSKITQSFAAGWFNRHAQTRMPEPLAIQRFLAVSMGKIREELQREGTSR